MCKMDEKNPYFSNGMNRTVMEWIFLFSGIKEVQKSWSKVTVTDPWERLVSRHLDSSRQNFIRMKVEMRLCVVTMDIHICHDGELIYTALAA